MDDIDAMFSNLLGEMDLLTQSLGVETLPPESSSSTSKEVNFTMGFADMNVESLNELEENDFDALMADLMADLSATENKLVAELEEQKDAKVANPDLPAPPRELSSYVVPSLSTTTSPDTGLNTTYTPLADSHIPSFSPPQPPQHEKPSMEDVEAQIKSDKIKLALEKLKEAKVKKLVVKVVMNDGSSKTLMVDERQTVRDVLDNLFEKTHCDCNVDWSLSETNPELQLERGFEDHENLVDPLSAWTRDSENKVLFQERTEKYEVFKNPQNFYLWKKDKKTLKDMKDRDKELLVEENFCGPSIIVPDLEGVLYLREDNKKSWKPRLFLLRASGIYYVPKGKSKTRDLVCFVQFDNVNVYYGKEYKNKYKAPTDFCFVLKHPQIQKESQYIKYLCCDDSWMMTLWVTGIRIAKYGKSLYENYKTSMAKAQLTSAWNNRSTTTTSTPSTSSTITNAKASGKANGYAPQPPEEPVANIGIEPPPPPPLPPAQILPPHPTVKRSPSPNATTKKLPSLPTKYPPSQATIFNLPAPPLSQDDSSESPPDFLPPPPPLPDPGFLSLPPPVSFLPPPPDSDFPLPPPPPDPAFCPVTNRVPKPAPPPRQLYMGADVPAPPPPPPPSFTPTSSVIKTAPLPPKRTTPMQAAPPGGGDFMSELARAMAKKRANQ
ncbi:amyloid beta A4 precursor protein-binding family B member 1-interacting protein [Esox lucius]|nr:amyloid beta A4 precursor protein-binding family B member 1-interacting protein [Esox lucius]